MYNLQTQAPGAKGTDKIFYTRVFQHCVYTGDPHFLEVMGWLRDHNYKCEPHVARTRFWIPKGPKYTEFVLRWGSVCPNIDHETDHALGQ